MTFHTWIWVYPAWKPSIKLSSRTSKIPRNNRCTSLGGICPSCPEFEADRDDNSKSNRKNNPMTMVMMRVCVCVSNLVRLSTN